MLLSLVVIQFARVNLMPNSSSLSRASAILSPFSCHPDSPFRARALQANFNKLANVNKRSQPLGISKKSLLAQFPIDNQLFHLQRSKKFNIFLPFVRFVKRRRKQASRDVLQSCCFDFSSRSFFELLFIPRFRRKTYDISCLPPLYACV